MKEKGKLIESPESRPIKPIGLRIIDNPKLEGWLERGQARQEADGLWLHYAVVCTLLRELREAESPQQASELDKELGRWQKAIYELCKKAVGTDGDFIIDGGGCDSGDALDFTLTEIGQAFSYLKEREAESPRQADRTPQDYAIEHGGYLADAAQAYLDEKNRHDMAVAGYADEVPDTDSLSDHHQALRNAIYEFRKRAEKSREVSHE